MKKSIFLLIISAIFLILLVGCSRLEWNENDGSPYPKGGRDTVAEFGIRRYVILRGVNSDSNKIEWTLYDNLNGASIDDNIDNYIEIAPYVYCIGTKGNTKLNYETEEWTRTKNLTEYSEEDQAIFNDLEETKSSVIKR